MTDLRNEGFFFIEIGITKKFLLTETAEMFEVDNQEVRLLRFNIHKQYRRQTKERWENFTWHVCANG